MIQFSLSAGDCVKFALSQLIFVINFILFCCLFRLDCGLISTLPIFFSFSLALNWDFWQKCDILSFWVMSSHLSAISCVIHSRQTRTFSQMNGNQQFRWFALMPFVFLWPNIFENLFDLFNLKYCLFLVFFLVLSCMIVLWVFDSVEE